MEQRFVLNEYKCRQVGTIHFLSLARKGDMSTLNSNWFRISCPEEINPQHSKQDVLVMMNPWPSLM